MGAIGILTIHGMGEPAEDFDRELRVRLARHLAAEVRADLVFESIWFSGEISGQQDAVWAAMQAEPLDMRSLRHFFLYYFSDATAYVGRPDPADALYRRVHRLIRASLDALRARLGGRDAPVVVVAHSLGCQVISDYIWDAQRGQGIWAGAEAPTLFQRLGTARLMVTSGCNIPLFVSGLPRIEAIDPPHPGFRWINFYDRDDVLGWPLRPLSEGFPNSYRQVVEEDREMNVGGVLGWSPLSHTQYWKDRRFTRALAELVAEVHRAT